MAARVDRELRDNLLECTRRGYVLIADWRLDRLSNLSIALPAVDLRADHGAKKQRR